MHDTDATSSVVNPTTLRDPGAPQLSHSSPSAATPPVLSGEGNKAGMIRRLCGFFARLFFRKRATQKLSSEDIKAVAARKAAALAAQLPPPMAFKGEAANTLVIPTSAYAGKPVEQALRKRAEQQFKTMDITQTTVH